MSKKTREAKARTQRRAISKGKAGESQSEKELKAYTKRWKETMKNWNHNTMKMYPPTPAEWQRNKQYYERIKPNAKGGKLKKGGKAK